MTILNCLTMPEKTRFNRCSDPSRTFKPHIQPFRKWWPILLPTCSLVSNFSPSSLCNNNGHNKIYLLPKAVILNSPSTHSQTSSQAERRNSPPLKHLDNSRSARVSTAGASLHSPSTFHRLSWIRSTSRFWDVSASISALSLIRTITSVLINTGMRDTSSLGCWPSWKSSRCPQLCSIVSTSSRCWQSCSPAAPANRLAMKSSQTQGISSPRSSVRTTSPLETSSTQTLLSNTSGNTSSL